MAGHWPLVGRDAEMRRLADLLSDSRSPGVVLSGPSGVGKTRLGTEGASGSGRRVIRVSATRAAATIPLGAFAPYLPPTGLGGSPDHNALRLAADALVTGVEATDADDDTPPVIFVDDAHALDDASATLLLHLAVMGRAFLLVTFRTGEAVPDALRHLWKDVLPRIDLEPFQLADVASVLEAELGGKVDNATVHAIHAACQGNALYLRELLSGLIDGGAFDDSGGMWTLKGAITAPPRLVELVTERLDGLTERERFVLQTLALTEPMGLPVVEGLKWADEWGSLERKGLAEVRRSRRRQQLFVAHPLHAEVLRATITTRRKNAILKETAKSVALFNYRRRDDARRIAVWKLDAGEPADPAVLEAAARDSALANDNAAALRFAAAARDAGAGFAAALLLGIALDNAGRHADAEVALAEAERLAEAPEDLTVAAMSRGGNLFRGLARSEEAHFVVLEAEQRVPAGDLRDQLIAERATFALFEGNVATTLALTEPMLAHTDEASYCIAALPAAMIRVMHGRITEAIDISTRAFDVRVSLTDNVILSGPGVYLVRTSMALTEAGRLAESAGTAQTSYDAAAAEQDRNGMAWLATALGRVHLLSGQLAAAARLGSESALLFGELNHPGARWGYALAAISLAQLGDAEGAEAAMADLDAERDTTLLMMEAEVERARGWTLAARGDLPRARANLLSAADVANRAEQFALEAGLLHDIARLGDGPTAATRLNDIAQRVDGGLMPVRVMFANALADDDAEMLERSSAAFEALGAILFAAEAANEAGIAHRKAGATRAAAAAAARSQLLAARCEGARTPALLHGTGTAVLTKREREVAALASHGLASKEIASTLYVSIRTVDNHLQHAYEKLGVTSRNELADALAHAGY